MKNRENYVDGALIVLIGMLLVKKKKFEQRCQLASL